MIVWQQPKEKIKMVMCSVEESTAQRVPLNDLYDRYISQKFNLKETTLAGYIYYYNSYVRDTFGQRKIVDIKYSDIKKFYYSLMEERGLAATSVEHVHTQLHPAFALAVREDIIRKNPSDDVMTEIKKSKLWIKPKRHALTIPQQKAFVNFLEESPEFKGWYPVITILLGTGMRIGECFGLRWEDIDFENRIISVNHNLTDRLVRRDRRIERYIQSTKIEAGYRSIPIVDEVMEAFLLEYQIQKCLGFCEEEIDGYSGFVFTIADHTLYQVGCVNRAIHRATDAYNEREREVAKRKEENHLFYLNSAYITYVILSVQDCVRMNSI